MHEGIEWTSILARLEANPKKLCDLNETERTGGEPDVVVFDKDSNEYVFCDCVIESPKRRRSVCSDREVFVDY